METFKKCKAYHQRGYYFPGVRLYHRSCAAVRVYQGHDQQRKTGYDEGWRGDLKLARDTLVNDDDMAAALEAGKVARYVSDFPNPKVVHMKHVILTPHLGASTRESEDNCAVMAVQEITDYLENGNIKNSVNYPACDMGVCQAASRIAVLHMNIPNMIGQITAILAAQGVNISDMTNKSRDKYAYTLLDLEHKPEETTVEKLKAIEGVLRVRVVK